MLRDANGVPLERRRRSCVTTKKTLNLLLFIKGLGFNNNKQTTNNKQI